MRRIINSTYITLDGIIENPQDWPSGRHKDDGIGGGGLRSAILPLPGAPISIHQRNASSSSGGGGFL